MSGSERGSHREISGRGRIRARLSTPPPGQHRLARASVFDVSSPTASLADRGVQLGNEVLAMVVHDPVQEVRRDPVTAVVTGAAEVATGDLRAAGLRLEHKEPEVIRQTLRQPAGSARRSWTTGGSAILLDDVDKFVEHRSQRLRLRDSAGSTRRRTGCACRWWPPPRRSCRD